MRAIRARLGLSQTTFARRFSFSVRTVPQREPGRALPDRPARILLRVIERAPETVAEVAASCSNRNALYWPVTPQTSSSQLRPQRSQHAWSPSRS